MLRFVLLLAFAADVHAAAGVVDIDSAAEVYQDAAIRAQVRASLGAIPQQIRRLFEADAQSKLSTEQLAAVTAAANRGFRIDVFEAPALAVLASNLDPVTVKKTEAFLGSDLGKRMVAADVAVSSLDQAEIDKVMNGEVSIATTPQRDASSTNWNMHPGPPNRRWRSFCPWAPPLPWARRSAPDKTLAPCRNARKRPGKKAVRHWKKACASRCAATWPMATAT
jgi:hypothetical protein